MFLKRLLLCELPVPSVCPQRTLQKSTLPDPPALPRPEIRAGRPTALGDHLPGSRPPRPAGRPCWLPRRLSRTLAMLRAPWRNGSSGMYVDPRTKRPTSNRLTVTEAKFSTVHCSDAVQPESEGQ